jgi:hypothetical protein
MALDLVAVVEEDPEVAEVGVLPGGLFVAHGRDGAGPGAENTSPALRSGGWPVWRPGDMGEVAELRVVCLGSKRADALKLVEGVVDIAVPPCFAGFVASDHHMVGLVRVFGGMPVGRLIATSDMAALDTGP